MADEIPVMSSGPAVVTDDSPWAPNADPFVGRGDGLVAIRAAIADAATGHGSLVLVAGEAGIGKTRLAHEAVRSQRDDCLVLWGTCSEGDGAPPYWPWTEALRPLIGSTVLPPEVVALLPDLAPHGAKVPESVPDEIRFRAFNLVADLLSEVGRRRPVVLVLDDLHWADPSSLELLRVVVRRAPSSHFAVVGTYRDTDVDPGHVLYDLLGELACRGPRIALRGLGLGEITALLAASNATVDPSVTASVARRTGGNPFFVREVLRSGDSQNVPPAVRDVLQRRIDRLPHPTRRVLEAAAVLGRVDAGLVAAVLDEEPIDVLECVDELLHRRLLVETPPGGFGFAHALVRETTLAAMTTRDSVELHGRAAAAIEARSDSADLEAIAQHRWLAAVLDPGGAIHWATEAGRAARRQLAYEQATRWFERALTLVPTGTRPEADLHIELAEAVARTSQGRGRGREAAAAAAEVARRIGDAEVLAAAAIAFGGPFLGILTSGFAEPEPVALADEALLALPPEPSALRARLLARVAAGLGYTPDHRRALETASEALAVARAVDDDDALLEALTAVTSIWNPADDPTTAARLLDEFESISRLRRSREGLVTVSVSRCLLALERGDRADLEHHIRQLSVVLGELHLPVHGAYRGLFTAMLHRLDGRYAEAEDELLAVLTDLGDQAEEFVPAGAQLMVVWNEQDRLGEVLDQARLFFGSDRFRGVPSARVVLAYVEAAVGDRSFAADAVPPLAREWSTTQRDPNWLMGLAWLCRTAVLLDDTEAAAMLLDVGRPFAARSVFTAAGTITLGVLGMWLAELAIMLGRDEEARALLDAAEAHDRRLQDRGHLVECEYLRGRLAVLTGTSDASVLLGAAAAQASALGMTRVARLARAAAPGAQSSGRPSPSSPAEGSFRRVGSTWLVRFGGVDAHVRDAKGMADLAVLLARPGTEVHVAELVGSDRALSTTARDVLLDDVAIASYRARLHDLSVEEDDAEADGDDARATRARAEREAVEDRLTADLGLGGASRSSPDWVERARKAVRRRVDASLKRIEHEHPAAGRHLRRSVQTGAFCTYDPAEPVHWTT
jgi:hypothetical protein